MAGLVALAASWLAGHYHATVMLCALPLGIAVNFLSAEPHCRPGIDFASRTMIHDVAQVVGAGYSVSIVSGHTATIVKLFRVALLLPAVFVISFLFRNGAEVRSAGQRPPLLPAFLVAFAVLVAVNSSGSIPPAITATPQETSRWCLVLAIAALGTKTSLGDLAKVSWKPVALFVGLLAQAGLGLA